MRDPEWLSSLLLKAHRGLFGRLCTDSSLSLTSLLTQPILPPHRDVEIIMVRPEPFSHAVHQTPRLPKLRDTFA